MASASVLRDSVPAPPTAAGAVKDAHAPAASTTAPRGLGARSPSPPPASGVRAVVADARPPLAMHLPLVPAEPASPHRPPALRA